MIIQCERSMMNWKSGRRPHRHLLLTAGTTSVCFETKRRIEQWPRKYTRMWDALFKSYYKY